jgi:hypothetical protein
MATKKQKEELIATLKFTPRTYQMLIQGYGGECYAGRVDRKIYDYFKAQKIDMDEYASSYDEFEGMPVDMQPFTPGSPFECDGLFHASGAELSDLNSIEVFDEKGNTHWECTAGVNDLEDKGVVVDEFGSTDLDDLEPGEVAFWGGQGEKGCFFDGEIYLKAPFDPAKLRIIYETCDGWSIINGVEYDGVEIDGSGGYSTTGKWGEAKWVLGGDEEVYLETVSVDDREDEGLTWDTWDPATDGVEALENAVGELQAQFGSVDDEWDPAAEFDKIVEEHMVTEWYPVDTNPVRKGQYEVRITKTPVWPFPATFKAEWTGRTWKDSEGKKVSDIIDWRGLKYDPTEVKFDCECVQCDWKGTVDETNDWDGQMCCPECGEPVEIK